MGRSCATGMSHLPRRGAGDKESLDSMTGFTLRFARVKKNAEHRHALSGFFRLNGDDKEFRSRSSQRNLARVHPISPRGNQARLTKLAAMGHLARPRHLAALDDLRKLARVENLAVPLSPLLPHIRSF